MYIELFLLDDLLLNLLIMRLAAAMLSVRPPMYRQFLAASSAALVSAAAAFLAPVLRSPLLRLPLLALFALGLPAKDLRTYLRNMGAVLFSTFVAGGCAVVTAYLTGGGTREGFITGGIPLRAALTVAVCVSLLPSQARRILRRRLGNEASADVLLLHNGSLKRFKAVVDTGNSLREPVTGLPVAVVRCPELMRYASLPIPAETAAGRTVLSGFMPERFSVNGREVACVVAVTERRMNAEAIIPPDIIL